MKDQIDIMKRKKISPSEQYSSGEGEGDSLDPPTIKKPGGQLVTGFSWELTLAGYGSLIQCACIYLHGHVAMPCLFNTHPLLAQVPLSLLT